MNVFVFLGPTLPVNEARRHLDAIYLPPIEQGDLIRLLLDKPYAVGIIDGRFQFVPSVWHKEILAALAQGVHVFGAASMGALRAAELTTFGMAGIGRVFEQYRDGVIEDDDEVAVAHAAAEHAFAESSDAMVNIRDVLDSAAIEGVISPALATQCTAIAKGLYYPERSWARVLEIARDSGECDPAQLAALDLFRRAHTPVKRRDAIELLHHMAEFCRQPRLPFVAGFELEQTVFLDRLRTEVELDRTQQAEVPGEPMRVARKKVLLELLAEQEARRLGIPIGDSEIAQIAAWFRSEYGLESPQNFARWSEETVLDERTFRAVMHRFAAVMKVQERYGGAIESALHGHVAVSSARIRDPLWTQWNVALSRTATSAPKNAASLFELLAGPLRQLRENGTLPHFYFMRKPPDIRLRFHGDPDALAPIAGVLAQAQRQGFVERYFPSIYEPETSVFGGPEAMDLTHDYFDADTRVWLEWQDAPPGYSLALLQDLFFAMLQSSSEVSQTWARLAAITGANDPEPERPPRWESALHPLHRLANDRLSTGLLQLWDAGALETGMREILSSLAMFHFNRYGIPGARQASLACAMTLTGRSDAAFRQHA